MDKLITSFFGPVSRVPGIRHLHDRRHRDRPHRLWSVPEMILMILEYLPTSSLQAFVQCDSIGHAIASKIHGRRLLTLLGTIVGAHVPAVHAAMVDSGAVISGPSALWLCRVPCPWFPKELAFVVPCNQMVSLLDLFDHMDIPRVIEGVEVPRGSSSITVFNHCEYTISMIESSMTSILFPIVNMPTTMTMNVASMHELVCFYPRLTFSDQAIRTSAFDSMAVWAVWDVLPSDVEAD
ncbi:hypothetical protein JAAARDRAFT_198653 [Jaapia argillacea MUCL 33604]|uniref:Uncharacterized protein n=1 Tax=Jaapia argillacea MUCL 33604 TaxID=933084 RepID=A0A067PNU1_9AGAM|nr:hypothetical protein JAAARDRAFT_198653 [Jaapia argillacea MUCL 33604]